MLSIDRERGKYNVYASNIGEAVKAAELDVYVVKGKRKKCILHTPSDVQKDTSRIIARLDTVLADGEIMIAEITAGELRDRTYYRVGAPSMAPTPCEMKHDPESRTVAVTATRYVHAVELDAEAVFSDNCFSLMPGETVTVSYRPIGEVGEIKLTAYSFI